MYSMGLDLNDRERGTGLHSSYVRIHVKEVGVNAGVMADYYQNMGYWRALRTQFHKQWDNIELCIYRLVCVSVCVCVKEADQ